MPLRMVRLRTTRASVLHLKCAPARPYRWSNSKAPGDESVPYSDGKNVGKVANQNQLNLRVFSDVANRIAAPKTEVQTSRAMKNECSAFNAGLALDIEVPIVNAAQVYCLGESKNSNVRSRLDFPRLLIFVTCTRPACIRVHSKEELRIVYRE